MALKKKKEYKNGTNAEYHNIGSIELIPYSTIKETVTKGPDEEARKNSVYPIMDYEMEESKDEGYQMVINVRSYVSEKVRRKDPSQYLSASKKYQKIPKEAFNSADIFQQAYNFIKNSEEFSDSEDA